MALEESVKMTYITLFDQKKMSCPKTWCNYDSRLGIKIAKSLNHHRFIEDKF